MRPQSDTLLRQFIQVRKDSGQKQGVGHPQGTHGDEAWVGRPTSGHEDLEHAAPASVSSNKDRGTTGKTELQESMWKWQRGVVVAADALF
jgi:hypothetical protein